MKYGPKQWVGASWGTLKLGPVGAEVEVCTRVQESDFKSSTYNSSTSTSTSHNFLIWRSPIRKSRPQLRLELTLSLGWAASSSWSCLKHPINRLNIKWRNLDSGFFLQLTELGVTVRNAQKTANPVYAFRYFVPGVWPFPCHGLSLNPTNATARAELDTSS